MNSIPILFEDGEILVIDKPQGLASQGGAGIGRSLDSLLPEQLGIPCRLVHRLDRDTGGLMVVAKSPTAAAKWIPLVAGGRVKKEYRALCFGVPSGGSEGVIRDSIEKNGRIQEAVTRYRVLATRRIPVPPEVQRGMAELVLSDIRLALGTGRTHQIRIHMAGAGAPIAGDDRHGDFRLNKVARKLCGIKSLRLFSFRLSLPLGGGVRSFEIPVPWDGELS